MEPEGCFWGFCVRRSRGSGNVNYGSNHWFFSWMEVVLYIVLRRFLWTAWENASRMWALMPPASSRKFQSRWSNFNIICVLAPPQRNGSEAVCAAAVKCVCVWIIIIILSTLFYSGSSQLLFDRKNDFDITSARGVAANNADQPPKYVTQLFFTHCFIFTPRLLNIKVPMIKVSLILERACYTNWREFSVDIKDF